VRRCFHNGHCGLIDSCGDVHCCKSHPNPHGFFRPRKRVVGFVSFSELWAGVRR
jgi:hypothetical protein